jgi:predicted RNase H-like HicB family nuclease
MAKQTRSPGAGTSNESFLLSLNVKPLENGRFLGRCAGLPGLLVEGESVEEVLRLAPKVARALIEAMREKGVELPPSLREAKPPVRVNLVVAA